MEEQIESELESIIVSEAGPIRRAALAVFLSVTVVLLGVAFFIAILRH